MKVVIVGSFSERARENMAACFPAAWTVRVAAPENARRELADADALIPEHSPVDAALLEAAPRLRMIQTGAGYDNVDLDACAERGIRVCSAPGINANAVAEHVMAFLLCWYKNILYLDSFLRQGRPEEALRYTGAELGEKTVGVVGLGHTGRAVAAYCRAFHMRVLGCSPRPAAPEGVERCTLDRLLRESDVVTLHVPLRADTRRLLGAEAFEAMKPDALLINTSRGAVVDERALIQALRDGVIGGACLDVYEEEPLPPDSPLRTLPNVVLTPHTAGLPNGEKFHKKRFDFYAYNIRRFFAGEDPEGRVDPCEGVDQRKGS